MDMKKTAFLSAFVFLWSCSPASDDVVLTFNVDNHTAAQVVVVCGGDVNSAALDSIGVAEMVIGGVDAAYAKVYYGMTQMDIYMEKGDKAVISFDANDPKGTLVFDGKKKQAVEYLRNVTLTPLPDEAYALPFGDFLKKLDGMKEDALKLLAANAVKGAGDFVEMEKARIAYSYATPILMYPVGHALMAQDPGYVLDEGYYEALRGYFVCDERYVSLDEYRNFIIEAAHVLDEQNRYVKGLSAKTVAQMRFLADSFDSPQVVAALLHYLTASYVDTFGIDNIDEMLSIYRTYVKDPDLLEDFAVKYDKWDRSKPGKPSPDFNAVDIDGRQWNLSDLKGKYVYIDMWATWCNPCRRELPYLKELEKQFKDAEIVFLGLSIDGEKANWEKMVKGGSMIGTQLYLGPGSSFQTAYNIKGIPRFILLDKEGVIISNDMTRPSAPETVRTLEALEGIR